MNIWVVGYCYGDINGIVCATEDIYVAISKLILDAESSWATNYSMQCWKGGQLIGEILADLIWSGDGSSINEAETFKYIKEKCKIFEIEEV